MAKLSTSRVSALTVALQAGLIAKERWERLSVQEQARLQTLLVQSRGRPKKHLDRKGQRELKRLTGKLELTSLGRELLPLWQGRKRGKRR